jgi:hypothetical protein
MPRARGFEFWFGDIDLNTPLEDENLFDHTDAKAKGLYEIGSSHSRDDHSGREGTFGRPTNVAALEPDGIGTTNTEPSQSGGVHANQNTAGQGLSNTKVHGDSSFHTGVTLSSEESDGEGEVQSTPKGVAPKTPYVGMVF